MYKQFFGLKANPFNINPDPRYLLATPHIEEALACLCYGIRTRRGFILLTGDVGTGKTTLIYKLLDWLHAQNLPTAFLFNSLIEPSQLFEAILSDLGLPYDTPSKVQRLLRLNTFLLERFRARSSAVVIIDEAQNLSAEVLEEIRMLANLETATEKLLQIVLVGQPELEEKLRQPNLRALRQRIMLRARTFPLSLEETQAYIAQRLRIAGATDRSIFSSAAIDAVHRFSEGTPRLINVICEHALISAFVDQKTIVEPEIIEAVATDLELTGGNHKVQDQGAAVESAVDVEQALKALAVLADRVRRSTNI